MKTQAEELAKSNENSEKNLKAIQEGFAGMQDSMSDQAEALKESSKAQAKSTTIMVFSIVGIAILILIIVLVVIVIVTS